MSHATTLTASTEAHAFPSVAALRAVHSELLKRERAEGTTPAFLAEVHTFIARGRVTGALLDAVNDRRTSQSLLDYWSTVLYRADDEAVDSTLAPFDPSLAPTLPDTLCPYVGLEPFHESNRDRFFGRRALIEVLIQRLAHTRLLAVLGPSGSGKSSLVQGGLLPALRRGALPDSQTWWYVPPVVPGSDPLVNLAQALRPRGAKADDWPVRVARGLQTDDQYLVKLVNTLGRAPAVLVIDQFEEAFTLCFDARIRTAFITNLLHLSQAPGLRHTVIFTMRTDFEGRIARIPTLQAQMERATVRVTPMSASELREAIEEPARAVGLKIEPRVAEALINDVLDETAELPLLQFTLLKLWEARDHNRVTWEAYQRLGGGREALKRSADAFYARLSPEQQITMRRILMRMVRPGDGLEFTSNRIPRAQLYRSGEATYRIDDVLDKLVTARLVRETLGDNPNDTQVEVAHEALVRNWPRLVAWLERERDAIRERQRLTSAAEQWEALNRDPSVLLRGALLDAALSVSSGDLNQLESAFLRASLAERITMERAAAATRERERELLATRAAEAERQRELQQAHAIAAEQARAAEAERQRADTERQRAEDQAHARRRLRLLTVGLAAALIVTILIGAFAFVTSNELSIRQQELKQKQDELGTVQMQANNIQSTVEQLDVTRRNADSNARLAQHQAETAEVVRKTAYTQAQHAVATAILESSNRSVAQTQAAEAQAQAAEAQVQAQQAQVTVQAAQVQVQLAQAEVQAARDQASQLIAEANQTAQAALSVVEAVKATQIQTEDDKNKLTARLLAELSTREGVAPKERISRAIASLRFNPNQPELRRLVAQNLEQFNGRSTNIPVTDQLITWSPVGNQFAVANGSQVQVWEVGKTQPINTFKQHRSRVTALIWDTSGISTGDVNGNVLIWNPRAQQASHMLQPLPQSVQGIAWNNNRNQLAIAITNTLTIWDMSNEPILLRKILAPNQRLTEAAWSPDGTWIVTANDQRALVWNVQTGTPVELQHRSAVRSATWSSDGRYIATLTTTGQAYLWTLNGGIPIAQTLLSDHIQSITWGRKGTRLVTADTDGNVTTWDATTGTQMEHHTTDISNATVAVWSPDGQRLLVIADGKAQIIYADEFVEEQTLVPTLTTKEIEDLMTSIATPIPTGIPTPTSTLPATVVS